MDGAGAHPGGGVAPARQGRGWLGWLLPPATALVIVVAGVLLLMTPLWMHFALAQSGATQAFATPQMAFDMSDRTVVELFVGPGTFVQFGPDEAAHLRDVRVVMLVFVGLAIWCAVLLAWSIRGGGDEVQVWRAIARGGAAMVVGTLLLGAFAVVSFDLAFELFHRIFFPGGNWAFATGWMIRLYPEAFWQLTAAALGVLCVLGGGAVWWFARRRAR